MVPKFGRFEKKSEISGKFWNVVLENDEDQLHRSFEKWSDTKSQVGEDYPTNNKKKES